MKAASVATQVIDKLLGRVDFTPPATLYLALYIESPSEDGGGTECALSNGYARTAFANNGAMWPGGVSGDKSNALTIQCPTPTGPWGTVIAFGFHTHATDDTLYLWGDLDELDIDVGSDPKFLPGDLMVEES